MNTDQKIIKNRVGVLKLAEMLGNVSQACKMMGYSRDSFYRLNASYPGREYELLLLGCNGAFNVAVN